MHSTVFQVEHDQPADRFGEGAYTVLKISQPFKHTPTIPARGYSQTFAILWDNEVDNRLINFMEIALKKGSLEQIILIYAAEQCLHIIYNPHPDPEQHLLAAEQWESLISEYWGEDWIIWLYNLFEFDLHPSIDDYFNIFANDILDQHSLGIRPLSTKQPNRRTPK